jgi:(R,R)-butanediol dehydrogenase/meso-butanediol dehydrogenase/diacetyl reductase
MRAAVLTDEHRFEVTTLPDPTPEAGQLVVAVRGCGICGSDRKSYEFLPAGSVLGHEFYGEIVAVGADAGSQWRNGQLVTALPLRACGQCRWCAVDEPAHCVRFDPLGVGGSAGAFAQFVTVDASLSVPLPAGVGEFGALVEPLAVGLHALRAGEIAPGDRVLVIGGGSIGTAVTVWARRLGASEVVVSDPSPAARSAAAAFGATGVHDPGSGAPAVPATAAGFDLVVECVGAPGLVQVAIDAAAVRGRVVVAGVNIYPDELNALGAVMKEVTVRFAVYYRRSEFAAAADLVASGQLPAHALAMTSIGLDAVDAAFHNPTFGKVLITP